MTYNRPTIDTLGDATKAIQSAIHKNCNNPDSVSGQPALATSVAYEADE
jgi:hypothetical protein